MIQQSKKIYVAYALYLLVIDCEILLKYCCHILIYWNEHDDIHTKSYDEQARCPCCMTLQCKHSRTVNVQELRHAVKAVEFKQHVVAAIAVFKLWICNNRCFKGFGILIFKTYYTINIHKEIIDDWIVLQMLLQTFAVNARVAPRLESCWNNTWWTMGTSNW